MAVRKGLKLNEYGLFRRQDGDARSRPRPRRSSTSGSGLPFIEPTLREDRGEIEAALAGELPDLITLRQIRGDLHTHTDLTDGARTAGAHARGGRRAPLRLLRGHRPRAEPVHAAHDRREDARAARAGPRAAGPVSRRCGCCTAPSSTSIPTAGWTGTRTSSTGSTSPSRRCTRTSASRRMQMTRRVIRAIENPRVQHHRPPHRRARSDARDPVDLDLEAVFEAAGRTGTALEINAYPDRLDLRDEHVLWARRHGVRFAIDTDAHAVRPPRRDAVRRRDRAAWVAHEGRRDQRLADHEAPAVPAQGRLLSRRRLPRSFYDAPGGRGRPRPARSHAGPAAARRRTARGTHRRGRGVRARRSGEPRLPRHDRAKRARCSGLPGASTCTSPTATTG